MTFAPYFGFKAEQMDVPDAYLKTDFHETIYIEIPQHYNLLQKQLQINYVLRLLRLLHGLKQSGLKWNKKAKKHLNSIGFEPIIEYNCVFFNKSTHVIITLYVDDLFIFAKSMTSINAVKLQLFNEYKMKNIGKASFILQIPIRCNAVQKPLTIDQSTYVKKIL